MSRSYRKDSLSFRRRHEPIYWDKFRMKEMDGINKELRSDEYGEALFPAKNINGYWYSDNWGAQHSSIHYFRREFYIEIQHILNNFIRYKYYHFNYRNNYLENFKIIKDGKKNFNFSKGRGYWYYNEYSWMLFKEIKKIIKEWEGDPIDALYYLLENKIIERVLRKYHRYVFNKNR